MDSVTFQFTMPLKLAQQLEAEARKAGVFKADLVREALQVYLSQNRSALSSAAQVD